MSDFEPDEEGNTEIVLSPEQSSFVQSNKPYPLFCGGFGSGKSLTASLCILDDLGIAPGVKIGAYAPTFDLLRLITVPYLNELFELAGEPYKHNKSENIFHLSEGRQVICRSMDNPARIVGYQTLRAHVDELDTLRKSQAENAWNKIIARNRQKIVFKKEDVEPYFEHKGVFGDYIDHEFVPNPNGNRFMVRNGVRGYTTPEGFNFAYERWEKDPGEGYEIHRASTYSNIRNLPHDYIDNLKKSYPPQLIEAYLKGRFVNLQSGSVYPNFSRIKNHVDDYVQTNDHLHVGMDFNVNNMAAGIHVVRGNYIHAVDEISKGVDTHYVCQILKEKYADRGHQITIYPDASGRGTTSKSASQSDITIIKSYGFKIKAKSKNPPIKDRVMSLNSAICNIEGERRYRVNTEACPEITESLEQQVYDDNGWPDKKSGHDHHCDEVGYLVHTVAPVVKKQFGSGSVRGRH